MIFTKKLIIKKTNNQKNHSKERIFEVVGYITKKEKLSSIVQDTDGALML